MLRVGNGKTASKVVLGVNSIPIRCIFDVFITAALYCRPLLEASHHFFQGLIVTQGPSKQAASKQAQSNTPVATQTIYFLLLLLDLLVRQSVFGLWTLFFFRFAVTVLEKRKQSRFQSFRLSERSEPPSDQAWRLFAWQKERSHSKAKGSLPTGAAVPLFTGACAFWCN